MKDKIDGFQMGGIVLAVATMILMLFGMLPSASINLYRLLIVVLVLSVLTAGTFGTIVALKCRAHHLRSSIKLSVTTSLIWVAIAMIDGVRLAMLP